MQMRMRTETKMSDRQRPSEGEAVRSNHDESLRHVIAGILSTIGFTPSHSHPTEMLPVSDLVIQAVRLMGQEPGGVTVGLDSEMRLRP